MPDHLTSSISIPALIVVQEAYTEENADMTQEIENLEADNFELRNQIIRLKLHNAALRKVLERQKGGLLALLDRPPDS